MSKEEFDAAMADAQVLIEKITTDILENSQMAQLARDIRELQELEANSTL